MAPLTEPFLRSVPPRPGVYLMLGDQDDLLYVGKAKSLRARLRSYARHRPGTDDRLDRLLASVRSVRWEECPTEAGALRRETDLLRSLRPPYNTTHAHLSKYLAIALAQHGDRVRLRLASEPAPDPEVMYFYPFAASTPNGLRALTRLLFIAQDGWSGRDAPSNITRSSGCELDLSPGLRLALPSFLEGRSPRLLRMVERVVLRNPAIDDVRLIGLAKDLGELRRFYRNGPRAVRRLQLVHGGRGPASAAELTRLLAAGMQDETGARVRHDSRSADELMAAYRDSGLDAAQIAARLNASATPRAVGSGRWAIADVLEALDGGSG